MLFRRRLLLPFLVGMRLHVLAAFNTRQPPCLWRPNTINNNEKRAKKTFSPVIITTVMKPSKLHAYTTKPPGEKKSSSQLFSSLPRPPPRSMKSPPSVLNEGKAGVSGGWSSSSSYQPITQDLPVVQDVSVWSDAAWAQEKMTTGETLQTLLSILQAAFLVTGNTVGAGMTVLPEVAREAGLGLSVPIVVGLYLVNLVSGMLISDVAIKQFEAMDKDKLDHKSLEPSSFLQLAESALGPQAGNAVSSVSLCVNWAVLAFALMRAGQVLEGVLPSSATTLFGFPHDVTSLSVCFAGMLGLLVSSSSSDMLSKITSAAVMVLFGSFASSLVPGLLDMQDPIVTLSTPGTHVGSTLEAVFTAAPIFLTTLQFQNVVPLLTKMLDYNRFKVTSAMAIGSGIPMVMYLSWCLAALGGGVDCSVLTGGPLMMLFSGATLIGSSVACTMSLSEEIQKGMSRLSEGGEETGVVPPSQQVGDDDNTFSLASVLLAILPPLAAGILFSNGEGFTTALSCAGGYGSPLLYGLLPVALAWSQYQTPVGGEARQQGLFPKKQNVTPGGKLLTLTALGGLSIGFIAQQLAMDLPSLFSAVAV